MVESKGDDVFSPACKQRLGGSDHALFSGRRNQVKVGVVATDPLQESFPYSGWGFASLQ